VKHGAAASRGLVRALGAAVVVLVTRVPELRAQSPRLQLEGRVDGIFAATDAIQTGIGVNVAAGNYVRLGAVGAFGESFEGRRSRASGRVDAAARFLLDPVRQARWGPYGGGGVSLRDEQSSGWRGYVLIFLGVDGPTIGGHVDPALEVGLGGGTRIGVVLRAARNGRR
jgi:hypothetical protein